MSIESNVKKDDHMLIIKIKMSGCFFKPWNTCICGVGLRGGVFILYDRQFELFLVALRKLRKRSLCWMKSPACWEKTVSMEKMSVFKTPVHSYTLFKYSLKAIQWVWIRIRITLVNKLTQSLNQYRHKDNNLGFESKGNYTMLPAWDLSVFVSASH